MNFKVGLFQDTWIFWVVIAVIVLVAPVTFGVAKARSWI
jgi:Mg2+ and Co2+ transporter CorA